MHFVRACTRLSLLLLCLLTCSLALPLAAAQPVPAGTTAQPAPVRLQAALVPAATDQHAPSVGTHQSASPGTGSVHAAAVADGFAYLAQNDSLNVVDMSDPDTPQLQASLPISGVAALTVVGNEIYAAGLNGIQLVNVASPTEPQSLSALPLPEPARTITVSASLAYLGLDSSLQIVQVSEPASLTLRGALPTPGPVRQVQVSGTLALALHAADVDPTSASQLTVIDVSNPDAPRSLGSYPANAVALAGTLAFLATEQGLQILELRAGEAPLLRGSLATNSPLDHVEVAGSRAYLAGVGFWIVDVGNPDSPLLLGKLDGTFAGLRLARDLAFVVVSGTTPARDELGVVDIADSTLPWWYDHPAQTQPQRRLNQGDGIIALTDQTLFFLGAEDERRALAVLDIRDPYTPLTRSQFGPAVARQQLHLPLIHTSGPLRINIQRSIFGTQLEGFNDQRGLLEAQELGISWLRRGYVSWRAVQPEENGAYNWEAMAEWEQEFLNAQRAGMTPLIMVGRAPRWATSVPSDCGPIKPTHYDDYARFLQALVERYSKPPYNIYYWELGNEPDVDWQLVGPDSGFGCWGSILDTGYYGGVGYGEMLRVVYPAVKAVNPKAQIVFGGLLLNAPVGNTTHGFPERFLRGVLEAQKNDPQLSFDMLSYHGYGYHFTSYSSPFDSLGGFVLGKAAFLRQELGRYGRDVPLINTETAVLCVRLTDECRQRQADYMARIYAETLAGGLVGSLWYLMDTDDFHNTGLVDRSTRQPRAHYYSLRGAVEQLRAAYYLGVLPGQESGVVAYRFGRGDHSLLVAWSERSPTLRAPVPAGSTPICKNRDGVSFDCPLQDNSVTIPLTRSPVYVIFKPVEATR